MNELSKSVIHFSQDLDCNWFKFGYGRLSVWLLLRVVVIVYHNLRWRNRWRYVTYPFGNTSHHSKLAVYFVLITKEHQYHISGILIRSGKCRVNWSTISYKPKVIRVVLNHLLHLVSESVPILISIFHILIAIGSILIAIVPILISVAHDLIAIFRVPIRISDVEVLFL